MQAKSANRHRNVDECFHCAMGHVCHSQCNFFGKSTLSSAGIDDMFQHFLRWQPLIALTGWMNLHLEQAMSWNDRVAKALHIATNKIADWNL
jgi:hypothetical protein